MRKRICFFILVAAAVIAQESADLARLTADSDAVFKLWRESDPKLEAELVKSAPGLLDGRIRAAAANAQKATAADLAVANEVFQIAKGSLDWLDQEAKIPTVDLVIASLKATDAQLTGDANLLDRNIQVFASDPDPGIQKVKAAMDKERAALRAVRESLAAEENTLAAIKEVGDRGETNRAVAVARFAEQMAYAKQEKDRLEREGALWQSYFQALPKAYQASPGAAAQMPVSKTTIAPGTPRNEPGRVPINRSGPSEVKVPEVKPPAAKPTDPVSTPSSSAAPPGAPKPSTSGDAYRWIGEWTYPATNGLYSGEVPEIVEVVVREENGRLLGTFSARFKIPKGAQKEPVLRLDFSGALTATRGQKLNAVTPDGVKGVLELLPGAATNLVEVTWQVEASAPVKGLSKVRQGDIVLLKK